MKRYIRSTYTLNGVLKDVDEVVEEVDALIRNRADLVVKSLYIVGGHLS